jgi:hypothetical protein
VVNLPRKTVVSLRGISIRRIQSVVSELVANNEKVVTWKVMRKAGLKKEQSEFVKKEVEKVRKMA